MSTSWGQEGKSISSIGRHIILQWLAMGSPEMVDIKLSQDGDIVKFWPLTDRARKYLRKRMFPEDRGWEGLTGDMEVQYVGPFLEELRGMDFVLSL